MDTPTNIQNNTNSNNTTTMTEIIKKLTVPFIVSTIIFLTVIFTSEAIFGDLTQTNSLKPLWIIIPVFAGIITFLFFKSKNK